MIEDKEALRNCNGDPSKYGSPDMFKFTLLVAEKLFNEMPGRHRIGLVVFDRNKLSNFEDISCICIDNCRFYMINNRVDSPSPSYSYVVNVVVPRLHRNDRTSSKCRCLPCMPKPFTPENKDILDLTVRSIIETYIGYKVNLSKRRSIAKGKDETR